jgi:hypothetical protein
MDHEAQLRRHAVRRNWPRAPALIYWLRRLWASPGGRELGSFRLLQAGAETASLLSVSALGASDRLGPEPSP